MVEEAWRGRHDLNPCDLEQQLEAMRDAYRHLEDSYADLCRAWKRETARVYGASGLLGVIAGEPGDLERAQDVWLQAKRACLDAAMLAGDGSHG